MPLRGLLCRSAIVEYFKTKNISVSKRSLCNVIHKIEKNRKLQANQENTAPKRVSLQKRNRLAIQKATKIIKTPNPPSPREIDKRCNVSQATVGNNVHHYLEKKTYR